MGIVVGFLLLVYLFAVLIISILAFRFAKKKIVAVAILYALLVFPIHWSLMSSFYLKYYKLTKTPEDLISIKKVVEYPESVYWEDNALYGFGKWGRKYMVDAYLDGKYLKKLALLGSDGKIYSYTFGNTENPEIFSSKNPPATKYSVYFNRIYVPVWAKQYIWADEISIIENNTGNKIAFSKRYLAASDPLFGKFDIYGPKGFHIKHCVGMPNIYGFDDLVLFTKHDIRFGNEYRWSQYGGIWEKTKN